MALIRCKNHYTNGGKAVFLHLLVLAWFFFIAGRGHAEGVPVQKNPLLEETELRVKPAEAAKIDIWEYQIEGNTLLDIKTIELALYPFLGAARLLSSIEEAADNLEAVYKSAGYGAVYVDIPEQDITDGRVTLKVVEASLSRFKVSGSRYHSIARIKSLLPSLQQGESVHLPSLREDINTINKQTANLQVTPVLKPGKVPGAMEMDIRVKDKLPVAIGLEVNNYNSLNTTRSRLAASFGYENLWLKNHSASLQWQTTPEDTEEVKVLAGTYILPVFADSRLAVYGVKSDSLISAVADVAVVGAGNIVGARLVQPLASVQRFLHTLSLGFDFKDFDQSVVLLGADEISTPIQYASFVGVYNASMLRPESSTKVGVSLAMGLRSLIDEDAEQEFRAKRFLASPSFKHLQFSIKREDRLPGKWLLNSRIKAQVADTPLISNEQFSIGGSESVRGYFESQSLMDNGVAASVELESPSIFPKVKKIRSFRSHMFVDIGSGYLKSPLPGQQENFDLSAAGLGFRLAADKVFFLSASAAYPLKAATEVEKGDWRFGLQLLADW